MNDLSIPGPVRARVHPAAISRVTRFFDGSTDDILTELLQNARRAGARRIDILTAPAAPGATQTLVSVIDDGCGIADPAFLLEFGETGWAESIRAEDPAGMGLYSLARRGCAVSSRRRDGPGWSLRLHPEHFLGEIDATPVPDPDAPQPHGTCVAFLATEPRDAVRRAIEAAGRHHPLPVFLDTERVSRRCFLEGAVHIETWRGLRFGVRADAWSAYPRNDLNFHGLVLRAGLPNVPTLEDRFWTVAADIEACPELELVLPARKEPVQNPFLAEMREAALRAIYRAMAAASPSPPVSRFHLDRALAAGIVLPRAPARLRPWRPAIADVDARPQAPPFAPLPQGAIVVAAEPDPQDAQTIHRAAERAGFASRLVAADDRLHGFRWYDALPRLADFAIHAVSGDRTFDIRAARIGECPPIRAFPDRPDAIRVDLAIAYGDGRRETLALAADLAFAGRSWDCIDDARPLVAADSDLDPGALADLLRDAFFAPSDDASADSWETQQDRFEEDAQRLALAALLSRNDARRDSIAAAVRRHVLWLAPRGADLSIDIRDGRVEVQLGPAPSAARTAA